VYDKRGSHGKQHYADPIINDYRHSCCMSAVAFARAHPAGRLELAVLNERFSSGAAVPSRPMGRAAAGDALSAR